MDNSIQATIQANHVFAKQEQNIDSFYFFFLFMIAMFLLTGWSWWACTSPKASKAQREFGEFVIGTSWPLALMLKAKRAADHIIETNKSNKASADEADR